jgi:hypothetical protein
MELIIKQGNILNAHAEGLIITLDGNARGLEGNLARQFKARFPEQWGDIENELNFPIPLGRSDYAEAPQPFSFKFIFAVSILDHLNLIGWDKMPSIIRNALYEVCAKAQKLKINTIASLPLTGGFRLSASKALQVMVEVLDEFPGYHAQIEIYVIEMKDYEYLSNIARSFGIDTI